VLAVAAPVSAESALLAGAGAFTLPSSFYGLCPCERAAVLL